MMPWDTWLRLRKKRRLRQTLKHHQEEKYPVVIHLDDVIKEVAQDLKKGEEDK